MLSEDLSTLKTAANLTAKEIAQRADVSESTFSRILTGETIDPSFATVSRLVSVMGGSLDVIAGISHEINYRDELIDQCREDIAHERRQFKRVLIFTWAVVAFLLIFVALDIVLPGSGWVKY